MSGRNRQPRRRAFLRDSALWMAGLGLQAARRRVWGMSQQEVGQLSHGQSGAGDETPLESSARDSLLKSTESAPVTIGLVTDLHHADKQPAGTRYYRETVEKFREARRTFASEQVDFAVELGDLIDAAPTVDEELQNLDVIHRELTRLSRPWHFVLGNHCVHTLTKQEFLGATSRRRSFYAFDHGGLHFVVLDACFRADFEPYGRENFQWTDSNIPAGELAWLREDLRQSGQPTIVFTHQRLDRNPPDNHTVRQSPEVRKVLEESGCVVAVFQGHSHQNDYQEVGGIHYCTLRAMVEGSGAEASGYALLDAWPDGTLRLRGGRKQANHAWRS